MRLTKMAEAIMYAYGGRTVFTPVVASWETLFWWTVPIDVRLRNERRRLIIFPDSTKEKTDDHADQPAAVPAEPVPPDAGGVV